MRTLTWRFASVLAALFFTARASADPLYTFTNFGGTMPTAINSNGDVVLSIGIYHSYGPDAGYLAPNSAYGLGSNITISGINDSGQVTGTVYPSGPNSTQNAFVAGGGQPTTISNVPGPQFSQAIAINNSGEAILNSAIQGTGTNGIPQGYAESNAYIFQNGQLTNLSTAGLANTTMAAMAINNVGQIVGTYNTSWSTPPQGFLYSGGHFVNIGTLGGSQIVPTGINDLGQVVGAASLPGASFNQHAFVYSNGAMTDLGTLTGPSGESAASAINNLGAIVGGSNGLATLWQSGSIYNLNQLTTTPLPYALVDAIGINNLGQIIGMAYSSLGQWSGFLLTPTDDPAPAPFTPIAPYPAPEPSTVIVFALLGSGVLLRRKWARWTQGKTKGRALHGPGSMLSVDVTSSERADTHCAKE